MKKKSLLILPLLLLSLSACNEKGSKEDFTTYSNSFTETLNYIYTNGADTSKWSGIYGSWDTTSLSYIDMSYYGGEGYSRWEDYCYEEIDELYAVEKNGKVIGYEPSLYTDSTGDYIYDVYYDGSTIYTNDDGEISSIPNYKRTLQDYTYYITYYVVGEDALPEQFEYMMYLHDIGYDEYAAYKITGTISESSSGRVKATLKATCDEDFYLSYGFFSYYFHLIEFIELDLVYESDGSFVSFDYTYEDTYYDNYGEIDIITQYITLFEYDGDVPTPSWL